MDTVERCQVSGVGCQVFPQVAGSSTGVPAKDGSFDRRQKVETGSESRLNDVEVMDQVLDRFGHYRTCGIHDLQEECVTYAGSTAALRYLASAPDTLVAIVPRHPQFRFQGFGGRPFEFFEVDDPEYVFARIHNALNARRDPSMLEIDEDASIHPTAVIGPAGLKHVRSRYLSHAPVIKFKHMGSVRIHKGVEIGAKSVVHRGCLGATSIGLDAVIGSLCNIGHNAVIGPRSVLTAGVMVGGSAWIGANCWIGMGAVILNQVNICDHVRIGAGSVVTRDIEEPGVYVGSPAKWVREWDGRWETERAPVKHPKGNPGLTGQGRRNAE